ncbi:hypothetical protein Q8G81_33140, partial [Klebsiella pneumoniae]
MTEVLLYIFVQIPIAVLILSISLTAWSCAVGVHQMPSDTASLSMSGTWYRIVGWFLAWGG